jgi:hypothetical protein
MAIDERGLNGDQIPPFIIIGSYLNHHYICCYTLNSFKATKWSDLFDQNIKGGKPNSKHE